MKFFDRRPTAKAYGTVLTIMVPLMLVFSVIGWPVVAMSNMGLLNKSIRSFELEPWSCSNEACDATAALVELKVSDAVGTTTWENADRITNAGLIMNGILLAPIVILFLASLGRQAAPEPDFD